MKLDRYLKRKKITPEDFAAQIPVHASTIYRFLHGLSFPKSSNIRRITELTAGSVTANDFVDVQRPAASPNGRGRPRKPKEKLNG